MTKAKLRKSLSLRLQPYDGTVLAEVVDYLNSFEKEEANKKVVDILVMCLLPYARMHKSDTYTAEDLRLTCLEAGDAMDKHASTMRQTLRVEQPQFRFYPITVPPTANGINGKESAVEVKEPNVPLDYNPSPKIEGSGSAVEVNKIFGD